MNFAEIPVVILAGGRGSRLGEETDVIPKPMVKVQGVPIIERIVNHYKKNGFSKIIISVGYKSDVIFEYFKDWDNVSVFNTGIETQTAGRLHGVKEHINSDIFMACYGDGLTSYNPQELVLQHIRNGSPLCTLLAVHPIGRFGELEFDARGRISRFSEKPMEDKWISGGHFCFSYGLFAHITSNQQVLETDIFSAMVERGEMYCDSHEGFWRSLDTPKDLAELNRLELP